MTIEMLRAMLADTVKASVEYVQAVKANPTPYDRAGSDKYEKSLIEAVTRMQASALDFCIIEWCKAAGLPEPKTPCPPTAAGQEDER